MCRLFLVLTCWTSVALAQEASLRVESTPPGALVLLGATPVGHTPLDLSLGGGKHTLTVAAPGYQPVRHSVTLDPGVPKLWSPTLGVRRGRVPPDAPDWLNNDCTGVLSCGLGQAEHPSPPMAETLALARAAAEALELDQGVVRLRNATTATDAAWVRLHAAGRRRVTRVERWFDAQAEVAYVVALPGLPTPVTSQGAADPRGDPATRDVRARLAALCRALRWWFALRDGAQVTVESALFDPTPAGEVFARTITLGAGGSLGPLGKDVVLSARLTDRQAQRRLAGGAQGYDEASDDVVDVQIRAHGVRHVVRVRDGIATIQTAEGPDRVLADLERVLHQARIQTAYTPQPDYNGARVQRAILR